MNRIDAYFSDAEQVVAAANVLDASEFKVFKDAYAAWYGRDVEDAVMEPVFAHYLFFGVPPHWVRHYARGILESHSALTRSYFRSIGNW